MYIALYALIFLFPFVNKFTNDKNKQKMIYCTVIFGFLLLLVGLRHPTMGIDLPGYLKSYGRLYDMSWKEIFLLDEYLNYEKGYIIFNKFIATITFGNEQMFLFICAALALIPIANTVYNLSQDVLLSTVVYLGLPIFLLQYSALRQGIALGICIFALRYIEQKRFWPFALCVFFAHCFHYTAIVFVIAYFLYHIRIQSKLRFILMILFPIVYVFRGRLFVLLSVLLKNNAVITQTNAITLMLVFILIYVFLTVLFYGDDNEQVNGYMNIYFCACLCQIFSGVYETAIRVGYYFMIALIFLLPLSIGRIKDKRFALLLRWAIIGSFVWFAFDTILDSSWAMAYPYYFFWENIMY